MLATDLTAKSGPLWFLPTSPEIENPEENPASLLAGLSLLILQKKLFYMNSKFEGCFIWWPWSFALMSPNAHWKVQADTALNRILDSPCLQRQLKRGLFAFFSKTAAIKAYHFWKIKLQNKKKSKCTEIARPFIENLFQKGKSCVQIEKIHNQLTGQIWMGVS